MGEHDERIAAWLDGNLSPEEAARFEADMERDPALCEEVAAWQGNDDLLRAAYNGPIEQGVDDALLARMGLATVEQSKPAGEIVDFQEKPGKRAANDNPAWRRWAIPVGGALAACAALAVLTIGRPPASNTDTGAGARFAEAMESLPSRGKLGLPDGGEVYPVLSFVAADGRYCREFLLGDKGGSQNGIACKGTSGWKVEAQSRATGTQADPGKIGLAGGPEGGVLDATYDRLGASDPLSVQAERHLIASGWQKSSEAKKAAE
ncbi:MAG TPA: hypothetical protein VF467_03250 [Afipia sp.]